MPLLILGIQCSVVLRNGPDSGSERSPGSSKHSMDLCIQAHRHGCTCAFPLLVMPISQGKGAELVCTALVGLGTSSARVTPDPSACPARHQLWAESCSGSSAIPLPQGHKHPFSQASITQPFPSLHLREQQSFLQVFKKQRSTFSNFRSPLELQPSPAWVIPLQNSHLSAILRAPILSESSPF